MCTYICVYIYTYIYINTHTYAHTHIHTYIPGREADEFGKRPMNAGASVAGPRLFLSGDFKDTVYSGVQGCGV